MEVLQSREAGPRARRLNGTARPTGGDHALTSRRCKRATGVARQLQALKGAQPVSERGVSVALDPPKRLCVLVVDDQPDAADTVAMLLSLMGYDAKAAYSGRQALQLFSNRQSTIGDRKISGTVLRTIPLYVNQIKVRRWHRGQGRFQTVEASACSFVVDAPSARCRSLILIARPQIL